MKDEGWAYYELGDSYRRSGATHETAFPTFVDRVDALLRRETQTYITEIASLPQDKGTGDPTKPGET
jgi:hypothetical protein